MPKAGRTALPFIRANRPTFKATMTACADAFTCARPPTLMRFKCRITHANALVVCCRDLPRNCCQRQRAHPTHRQHHPHGTHRRILQPDRTLVWRALLLSRPTHLTGYVLQTRRALPQSLPTPPASCLLPTTWRALHRYRRTHLTGCVHSPARRALPQSPSAHHASSLLPTTW